MSLSRNTITYTLLEVSGSWLSRISIFESGADVDFSSFFPVHTPAVDLDKFWGYGKFNFCSRARDLHNARKIIEIAREWLLKLQFAQTE